MGRRQDYEEIKSKTEQYINLWNSTDREEVKDIFSPRVTFYTSTSLTMPDGAQHSLFGIWDFLQDYPVTDGLKRELHNYICRMAGDRAVSYGEISCKAYMETGEKFHFIMVLLASWKKTAFGWQIMDLKQELIPGNGNLKEKFTEFWYMDTEGRRDGMIQGEADSPWNQIPESESPLKPEEQVTEVLVKYFYGLEHQVFQHCYDAVSVNYGAYTKQGMGEGRRNLLAKVKKHRSGTKYEPHALRIQRVEVSEDRATIFADQMMEELPEYLDSEKDYSCCRETIELEREPQGWKIVYMEEYPGIYEL